MVLWYVGLAGETPGCALITALYIREKPGMTSALSHSSLNLADPVVCGGGIRRLFDLSRSASASLTE